MFPYKTSIELDRKSKRALYLQLYDELTRLIKSGLLAKNVKLPSSRGLASTLTVHRKTIVKAYEELLIEDWVYTLKGKGTYICEELPILTNRGIGNKNSKPIERSKTAGFGFKTIKNLIESNLINSNFLRINEGSPDIRLAPTKTLGMLYRTVLDKSYNQKYLGYGNRYGNQILIETLSQYLNETRGLHIQPSNLAILRGSQMGIYLTANMLLSQNEVALIGNTNYYSATITLKQTGAKLINIPVDNEGLQTDKIEAICQREPVKLIYVTSHHHHPTTITLSSKRRLELLHLAEKYKFAILEDDYDYDFHYKQAPILPLASADSTGQVVYIGALCKVLAPSFRNGYIVGAEDFIDSIAVHRGFIDRQSDFMTDLVFAKFIKEGHLNKHTKRVIKIYKQRRDLFCEILENDFKELLSFQIPEGGMAVWVTLNDAQMSWDKIRENAKKLKLTIPNPLLYDYQKIGHQGLRLGFASLNEQETIEALKRLKQAFYLK